MNPKIPKYRKHHARATTGLGRIVVAYAEKRRRVMRGCRWNDREVRERLKKLSKRERARKLDILRKTTKRIVELAHQYNAVVVVGNVFKYKRKLVEKQKWRALRHRLH